MILDYDRTLNISSEQRIESLMDSVQLALTNLETRVNSVSATVSSNSSSSSSDSSSGSTQTITVDSVISSTSQNPVQNKVIYTALLDKAENSALNTTNNRVTALENSDEEFQKGYDALVADNVVVKERITANEGKIGTLESDNVTIKNTLDANTANIQTLTANSATIEQLNAANASIKKLETEKVDTKALTTNYAHITDGVIDNANIDFANINNVKITNADIEDATITSAKIESINGNKITDGSIVAKALSSLVIETLSNTNVYYQATDPWTDFYKQFIADGKTETEAENLADAEFQEGDVWYQTLVATDDTTDDDSSTESASRHLSIPYIHRWRTAHEAVDDDGNTVTVDANWELLAEEQERIITGTVTSQEIATDTITANNISGGHITLDWIKKRDADGNITEELDDDFNEALTEWQDSSIVYNKWAELDGEKLVFSKNATDTTSASNARMELNANSMTFSEGESAMELSSSTLNFKHNGDNVASISANEEKPYFAINTSKQHEILFRESPMQSSNLCNLGIVAQSNGHISLKEILG